MKMKIVVLLLLVGKMKNENQNLEQVRYKKLVLMRRLLMVYNLSVHLYVLYN